MLDRENLFKNLAEDFKLAVVNYRKARDEQEIDKPYFGWNNEEAENKYYLEQEKRRNGINTSTDYINLTREEYWQNILIAKIEVIGVIGGFEMMQDFSMYLRKLDEAAGENNIMLESAFCYYADGISGWCR